VVTGTRGRHPAGKPPTLRIWEWVTPAVIIGSFQSLRNEVDTGQPASSG
jgi:lipoate-protein ligase A